jgi:hypothetical protein
MVINSVMLFDERLDEERLREVIRKRLVEPDRAFTSAWWRAGCRCADPPSKTTPTSTSTAIVVLNASFGAVQEVAGR